MQGKDRISGSRGILVLSSEPGPTAFVLYHSPRHHVPRENAISRKVFYFHFLSGLYFLRMFRRLLPLSLSSTLSLFLCVKFNWYALVCSLYQLICYLFCETQRFVVQQTPRMHTRVVYIYCYDLLLISKI